MPPTLGTRVSEANRVNCDEILSEMRKKQEAEKRTQDPFSFMSVDVNFITYEEKLGAVFQFLDPKGSGNYCYANCGYKRIYMNGKKRLKYFRNDCT